MGCWHNLFISRRTEVSDSRWPYNEPWEISGISGIRTVQSTLYIVTINKPFLQKLITILRNEEQFEKAIAKLFCCTNIGHGATSEFKYWKLMFCYLLFQMHLKSFKF